MLKKRIVTALILIPLVTGGIFYLPQLYFVILCAITLSFAAWEWAKLANCQHYYSKIAYIAAMLCSLPVIQLSVYLVSAKVIFLLSIAVWTAISIFLFLNRKQAILPKIPYFLIGTMGIIMLSTTWEALIILHIKPFELLLFFIIIWFADIGAYFAGLAWGKTPLAPSLSPKKSWEGVAGGIILAITGVILLTLLLQQPITLHLIGITILTVLTAIVGDLWESFMKRQQGVKDSGALFPGHGGMLDRIDSLIAAAPLFVCLKMLYFS